MEPLLDVKDAAEFLKVSEKSLRRWTASGKLNCYRVGGKRERRFYMRDLEEFLQGSQRDRLKPLGVGGHRVPDGSHMTHFYSGKEEALGVSVPYVLEGITQGEVVVVVMPPERSRELLVNLDRLNHSVSRRFNSGRLHVSAGMDSPEEMMSYLGGIVRKTDKFRLVGDMIWAIRKGWDLAALRALEETPDSSRWREGRLFLCQYSLEDFSGADIMMAAEAHTHVMYQGRMEKSPFYHQNRVSRMSSPSKGFPPCK